jgi:hypothetical protein
MSAIDQTIVSAQDAKPKKERAPRLPAKFGKFIEFGFYFVQFYNQSIAQANDGRTPIDQDALHLALQVFGSVNDQQSFVQGFFDNSKDVKKHIREVVKKFNKANAPATRKPRAKKSDSNSPSDSTPSESKEDKPKAKRGRKPAAVAANGNPDIVAEIVAIAQGNAVPPPPTPASKPPKLTAKQKKEAAASTPAESTPAESTPAESDAPKKKPASKKKADSVPPPPATPAESKKKASSAKKTKEVPPPATPATPAVTVQDVNSDDDDDDEEPLQVSILSLNGKQFLIDDNKTVYDIESQEPIGTFNTATQSINTL